MREKQFVIEIARPPEAVFALIADLPNYGKWLSASGLYADTLEISDNPIKLGTTYTDQGQSLPMHGEIIAFEPPSRLGFHQTGEVKMLLLRAKLDITILYRLETGTGTTLTRDVTLKSRRMPPFLESYVFNAMKKENPRILEKMKAYLEAQTA